MMTNKGHSYLDVVSRDIHDSGPLDIAWVDTDSLYREIYRDQVEATAIRVLSDLAHDMRYYATIKSISDPHAWIQQWIKQRRIGKEQPHVDR